MMVAWTKVVAVEVARRAYQLGLFQRYSQRLYSEGTFEGFSNGLDVGYEKQRGVNDFYKVFGLSKSHHQLRQVGGKKALGVTWG